MNAEFSQPAEFNGQTFVQSTISAKSTALPFPPWSTNAYSSQTSAGVPRLAMGDGCHRPASNWGLIAASNFEESVTVSARESIPKESQPTMVKIQQIEAHSSGSHGRYGDMAPQLSQAR